jgi:ApaG protein
LSTPTGYMEGCYHMVWADGGVLAAEIPRFPLVAPTVASGTAH